MIGPISVKKHMGKLLLATGFFVVLTWTIFLYVEPSAKNPIAVGVTKDNFDRIQFGASLEEVDSIVGAPFPLQILGDGMIEVDEQRSHTMLWIGKEGQISIRYTDGDGVWEKTWTPDGGSSVSESRWQQDSLQEFFVWLKGMLVARK